VGDLTGIHSHPNSLFKINLQQRMQNPVALAGYDLSVDRRL
jgi:hypothetical protein